MVLRELSESEWQHSFVPVLALAGSANKLGSAPGGGGDRAREHAVGDVKHIMVRAGQTSAKIGRPSGRKRRRSSGFLGTDHKAEGESVLVRAYVCTSIDQRYKF